MKKLLFLSFILCVNFSFGQELNEFELKSRKKADHVFSKIAESQSHNFPYLLLSSGNSYYLIIIDRKTHYTMVKANLDENDNVDIESLKSIKKSNKILNKAFDKLIYKTDFTGFQSDFFKNGYKHASGATTYFVMKDENRIRYGESSLSIIIDPSPINKEVYTYLLTLLINK